MRVPLLILTIAILTAGTSAQTHANRETARTRLRLQVLATYPVPVIDSAHADAKDIPGGFECGNTVKVTVNGKSVYHLFATTMEGLREKVWSYDRLEHWASGDGIHTCFFTVYQYDGFESVGMMKVKVTEEVLPQERP
jgi:hypothetical protein